MRRYYVFVALLLIVSIVAGVTQSILSAPARYDKEIERDFGVIESAVNEYARSNKRLPKSIFDLDLEDDTKTRANERKYEYKIKTKERYELCAEFKTDKKSRYSGSYGNYVYNHGKGYQCFEYNSYIVYPID